MKCPNCDTRLKIEKILKPNDIATDGIADRFFDCIYENKATLFVCNSIKCINSYYLLVSDNDIESFIYEYMGRGEWKCLVANIDDKETVVFT